MFVIIFFVYVFVGILVYCIWSIFLLGLSFWVFAFCYGRGHRLFYLDTCSDIWTCISKILCLHFLLFDKHSRNICCNVLYMFLNIFVTLIIVPNFVCVFVASIFFISQRTELILPRNNIQREWSCMISTLFRPDCASYTVNHCFRADGL